MSTHFNASESASVQMSLFTQSSPGLALPTKSDHAGEEVSFDAAQTVLDNAESHLAEPGDGTDEGQFFMETGHLRLLCDMIIQSAHDMAALEDKERIARLAHSNPEALEEIRFSAAWLSTPEGLLSIQIVFPQWDARRIYEGIKADPVGVVLRMQDKFYRAQSASRRGAENAEVDGLGVHHFVAGSVDDYDLFEAERQEG